MTEEMRQKQMHIQRLADELLQMACKYELNVTITRKPAFPLAMGNFDVVVETWPMRHGTKKDAA